MLHSKTIRPEIWALCLAALSAGCTHQPTGEVENTTANVESVDAQQSEPPVQTHDAAAAAAFYTVSHYDENGDPTTNLADAIARASSEKKRILLQVGGDWCGWCARISKYMESEERIRTILEDNFLVMKVTYPGKHAESFLAQYPKIDAYPHLFVLEHDGAFLHSQGTGELELGEGYNQDAFYDFLTSWAP